MKKVLLLVTSVLAGAGLMQAQTTLVSNVGGNITVQNGAVLTIEGSLENLSGGTVDNNGTIILQGDLDNQATFTSANPSVLRFEGNDTSKVTSGGAVFNNVEIAKDATHVVALQDMMTVGGTMNFVNDDNQVVIGDNNLVMQDAAGFSGQDNNEFVVTNGSGYVRKEGVSDGDGEFEFPVGYDSDTYNPARLTPQAGHTADYFDVRVLENAYEDGLTGNQITEGIVNATWEVNEGVAGGSDVNMELQWHESDTAAGFPNNANGISRYDDITMNWDLLYSDLAAAANEGSGNWSQTRSNVMEFSPFIVGGENASSSVKVELKAFLQGPYAAGLMSDALRTNVNNLLPEDEPYTGLGGLFTHQAFGGDEHANSADFDNSADGDDIVDWIFVELRDKNNSTSVVATKSALIQRDGDIVDVNGDSILLIPGVPEDDYFVALRHRNHLAIRTPTAIPLDHSSSSVHDFSMALANAWDNPSVTSNDAMFDMGGGVWGMHRSNANGDNFINIVDAILTKNGSTPIQSNVYLGVDINMDAIVNIVDAIVTKSASTPIQNAHID